MEDTVVDEGVRRNEEVGEEGGDEVELAHEDAAEGDGEDEDVAFDGVVIGAVTRGEEFHLEEDGGGKVVIYINHPNTLFNRPGVAGAVLHTASLLIN